MQRGRPGVPLPGHWSLPDAVRGEWQILAPCGHVWGGGPARPGQSGSSLLMFIILIVQVLITVRDITPRTQWLLHYSFTPVTDPSLGLKMTGAIKSEESGEK